MADEDLSTPPPVERGDTLWVDFRVGASRLNQVDTANETAYIKAFIALYWTDPRMIGYAGATPPDQLWGPFCNCRNGMRSDMDIDDHEFEIVNRDTGRMKRFLIFEGVVANNLDLTEFPFDTNSVDIEFGFVSHWRTRDGSKSGTSPMVPIYLVRSVSDPKEGDPIGIYWNKKIPEWELYGASWYLKTHVDKAGYTQQQLMLSFLVGRHVKFYALKVLLPLYLLLINFAADFLLPTKDLPSRSANTMTGFLAAFAFLYVIAGMLPKVEFLTRIDQIILVTLIGMTMCGIEAWVVYLLDEQQGTETAEQVNWIAGSVLGGLYVLINLAILVPGIRHKAHQLALHRVRAQTTARHVRGPAVTNKVVPVPGGAPPDEQGVTEWHIELCTSPKP